MIRVEHSFHILTYAILTSYLIDHLGKGKYKGKFAKKKEKWAKKKAKMKKYFGGEEESYESCSEYESSEEKDHEIVPIPVPEPIPVPVPVHVPVP